MQSCYFRPDSLVLPLSVATLFTLAPANSATSQTIHGTVLDAISGIPISSVDVALVTTADSIVGRYATDSSGRFSLRTSQTGVYRLRARRLGYAPFSTEPFLLVPGRDTEAEVRLQPTAIPLDSIEAIAEGRAPRLTRAGFYDRRAKGVGFFRTPEELEDLQAVFLDDLFAGLGSIRMRRGRLVSTSLPNCSPTVAIDGQVVHRDWTDIVHVNDIEAIEVYPSPAGVPVWLAGAVSRCGAVVLWAKGSR